MREGVAIGPKAIAVLVIFYTPQYTVLVVMYLVTLSFSYFWKEKGA